MTLWGNIFESEVSIVDKTEYRMKLDEINRLVEAQDYENALEIVDSIEWKRVKSVRTLCMVADIYEVNGELEESMRLLQLAYKRSSLGKMILYRQVELALKMGRSNDAVKYYNKYLETASNYTSKNILKYKICKAQNAPLEEQIAVLEEYKDREYTERWVYELAKLYKRADKKNKCIEVCDDLILWFGEGKYVKKAMEIKMSYEPLTPAQQQKYDKMKKEQKEAKKVEVKPEPKVTAETVAGISAAAMKNLQKASVIPTVEQKEKTVTTAEPQKKEEKPAEEVTGMDEVAATTEPKESVVETKTPEPIDTAKLQEKLAKSFQEVLSGINRKTIGNAFENLGKSVGTPIQPETEEENIEEYQVEDLEPEVVNEAKITADQGEAVVHRVETVVEPVEAEEKPEPVENKEIVSLEEMDLEALFAETSKELAKMAEVAKKVHEETYENKSIKEEASEATTEEPVETVAEQNESPEMDAAEAAMAAFEESLILEMGEIDKQSEETIESEPVSEESEKEAEKVEEETTAEIVEEIPEESAPEEEDFLPEIDMSIVMEIQKEKEAGSEVIEEVSEPENVEEESSESTEDNLVDEMVEEPMEENPEFIDLEAELLNAINEAMPEEEAEESVEDLEEKLAEAVMENDEEINAEDAAFVDLEAQLLSAIGETLPEEESAENVVEEEPEDIEEAFDENAEIPTEEATEELSEESAPEEEDFLPEIDMSLVMEIQKEKESAEEETVSETEEEPEIDLVEKLMAEVEPTAPEILREKETPEEKRYRILNATRPEKLTEEQKRMFTYFSKVPGMDDQILDAIKNVYDHADEKTSRRGNIAIMGGHGTGKTQLTENLVKAICKELGLEAIKFANLDASDMNQKDPATVIGKMAGGFLLIQRASFMTKETIEKLSQAMDFRTDSMILFIEDDKMNMRRMLAEYPEFAAKFDTVISIPVFTND